MTSFSNLNRAEQLERLEMLGRAALTSYDLRVERITLLRSENNAVFKVETGPTNAAPTYVLRIHRPGYRSIAETRSELCYVQALRHEAGLLVPEPVPTSNGELVTIISMEGFDEPRHCDLLTWLDGRVVRPGQGFGPRAAYQTGEFLGRVHRLSERYVPPIDFELPRWDADGLFTAASPYKPGPVEALFSPEDHAIFKGVEERIRDAFRTLGESTGEFGIIHADFILGNILFHRRSARVLDWDDCGWGYYLYDICPLLGNFKDYVTYRTLRQEFLNGYRSIRSLPREHEQFIDLLIAARHATSCLWAAGCQRNGGLGPDVEEHIAYRMGEVRGYLMS